MVKFSRSGVEKFLSCKRCFILQYKHKIRPPSLPFTLNNAVDNLCKNEFDYYRKRKEPHPLFEKHEIDAVPFDHPNMNVWRENFKGIRFISKVHDFDFGGAVDDVWVKPSGQLILSDVKATSKKIFNWEDTWNNYDWPKAYKRQLEMYQWLFRKNGFSVSNKAYLVYYNGLKDEPMFDKTLKFESFLVELNCNDNWVEEAIIHAKNLIETGLMPKGSYKCDTCQYLKKRWNIRNNQR